MPVVEIGARAFEGNRELLVVLVPGSVEDIGHHAFSKCTELLRAVLDEGVKVLHSDCFSHCWNLFDVRLPESLTTIYRNAFSECMSLREMALPDGLSAINQGVFQNCRHLCSVELPYGLSRIGEGAFAGCWELDDLHYFSKRGISATLVTDRELRENTLPFQLSRIDEGAFEDCYALSHAEIPYKVKRIPARAFKGCRALSYVGLHDRVRSVGEEAFAGCAGLASVRVPSGLDSIGMGAFEPETELVVSARSAAEARLRAQGLRIRVLPEEALSLHSEMHPELVGKAHPAFFTDQEIDAAEERYEIRHSSYALRRPADEVQRAPQVPEPRFSYAEGTYHGTAAHEGRARIMLTGDLMARLRQQERARCSGGFSFDESFAYVRDLFAQADLVVGNMESMVSASAPYVLEREHVDARPYLNAPHEFLEAIRRAGFDCVVNAQNHIYDTGVRGLYETLAAQNEVGLLHTGAFASPADDRFVVVSFGGIRVGIEGFYDPARQLMKKVNFTEEGREVLLAGFDEDAVRADIAAAKGRGANFVIAYCHAGREYTPEVTDRQRGFAQMLADAGADFVMGSHSHCVQPFELLTAADGRQVPCLFSGGNFISDMDIKPPITRDEAVVDLTLVLQADGSVAVDSAVYHPCRVLDIERDGSREYVVARIDDALELGLGNRSQLLEALGRITAVVGDGLPCASGHLDEMITPLPES